MVRRKNINTMNEQEANAIAVLEQHIDALNAHDQTALARTLHFPHCRLSNGKLKIWNTPDNYFDDFKERAGGEWSHSAFDNMQVVGSSIDKVHVNVDVNRFREDGTQITRFQSLWVIACVGGHWAAQMRSSFAPHF